MKSGLAGCLVGGCLLGLGALAAGAAEPVLQDYARPDELKPLPPGTASLYRVPWRAHSRTVSAAQALDGVGVYYKHIPGNWTQDDNTAIMKQMSAAGVKRMRLAPHFAIYITKDWTAPKAQELETMRKELRACKAAGIRPCLIFVHIPPLGKPGTRELQEWWRQGDLMPAGEVGSPEFVAYLDKTYAALRFDLEEAKAAGFTEPGSWDLELGQGLWWGAPAVPRPLPSTDLTALRPGGRIYEFDRALIQRLRKDGFNEPLVWWGLTYHQFENCSDVEVPPEAVGRTLSFYSTWSGTTTKNWLGGGMFDTNPGPNDVWPLREPLTFLEGQAPELVLAKPEGWMADRSRRDNLIELMLASHTPVAISSLGTVPKEIPGAAAGGLNGWQIKQRGLTRSLAFWLNQGAPFVLLHSAFEPGAAKLGEDVHSLIPGNITPGIFSYADALPLRTLRSFCDGLVGAKPLAKAEDLQFQFALDPDPVLIPATGTAGPLKASDALALLPFQLDAKRFAVAAYVVTPNLAQPMVPLSLTLKVDRRVKKAESQRPYTGASAKAKVLTSAAAASTLRCEIADDVTWIIFTVK